MEYDSFSFSAGATFNAGLYGVTVNATLTLQPNSDGSFTITGITGTREVNTVIFTLKPSDNIYAITSLAPLGFAGSDDLLFLPSQFSSTNGYLDTHGFAFTEQGSEGASGDPPAIILNFDPATGLYSEHIAQENEGNASAGTPVCFAQGTRIKTILGMVAVERLHVGDLAVTASGAARPIIWIGKRTIDCVRYPRPNEVLPVRIAAHAFAENRPARDLVVSPGHSIAVDLLGEVLIPASSLINGTTIRQEKVERITYWHVELESHDLLMAENLPTESYMEMGNRGFFPRPGEAMALHGVPDAVPATHADFCRPFHAAGSVVDFVRDRLAARALQLDWVQVENTFADLHLVVDGRRVEAAVQGLSARFLVPTTAETVWLESDTVVPAMAGGGADLRALGVCVGKLVIDDGFGPRVVMADDARLSVGFHHVEVGPQRWTAGRARLPASLWAGCRGSFFLRVDLTRPSLPRWAAPERATSGRRASQAQ